MTLINPVQWPALNFFCALCEILKLNHWQQIYIVNMNKNLENVNVEICSHIVDTIVFSNVHFELNLVGKECWRGRSNSKSFVDTYLQDGRWLGSSSQHFEYNLMYSPGVLGGTLSRNPSSLHRRTSKVWGNSLHGMLPLDISQSITPRLKMSDSFPYSYKESLKNIGSRYAICAILSFIDLGIFWFTTSDIPKSAIFATPSRIRILADDCVQAVVMLVYTMYKDQVLVRNTI
jgi:hypothetical protein